MNQDPNNPSPPPESPAQNQARFMRLYAKHQRRVQAFIATFLYTQSDVEDVLQDTSVILWQKFDQFEPQSPETADADFGSWARSVARLEVMRAMRQHGRSSISFDESVLDLIADEQAAMSDELDARRAALSSCMGKLAEADRALIQSCYVGDKQIKDIADELGRPHNSVYKSLGRIRGSLLRCIKITVRSEGRS